MMHYLKIHKGPALVVLSLVLIIVVKLVFIISLGDKGWEPDSYMHFLQLETIWQNFPNNLVLGLSVWAKPLYAYLYSLIITIFNVDKLWILQVVNVYVVAASSVIVSLIVRKLKFSEWTSLLALVLTNLSFTLFRSSVTVLTEPIFTLFLISSFYLLQTKRYLWSIILVGISVLGRIEGLWFVALWLIIMYFEKIEWRKILGYGLLMILPAFIWNYLGFLQTGEFFFLLNRGYPTEAGAYGFGSIFYYPRAFIEMEPIWILLLLLSLVVIWESRRSASKWLYYIALIFFSFIGVQMILWLRGAFGTAGLLRYFVSIIPFGIILAVYFIDVLIDKFRFKEISTIFIVLIICGTQLVFSLNIFHKGGYSYNLLNYPEVAESFKKAGEFIDLLPSDDLIFSLRPSFAYYSERNLNQINVDINDFKRNFDAGVTGVYLWEEDWSELINLSRVELLSKGEILAGWDQGKVVAIRIK